MKQADSIIDRYPVGCMGSRMIEDNEDGECEG